MMIGQFARTYNHVLKIMPRAKPVKSETQTEKKAESQKISIAPMMDWTDRHCRYFHKRLSKKTWTYTEMVTADAIIHGDRDRLLSHHIEDQPLCLQLGGSDPEKLKQAIHLAEPFSFEGFNLNVGCPSDRVKTGRFGACLMREPVLVRDCLAAMKAATEKSVSIKCRIGIDDMDEDENLTRFIEEVEKSGVATFIIHARKAWLEGLSPKQNREVPPLNYQRVYELKKALPHLNIIINGGVQNLSEVKQHLLSVDGVMIGRAAYQTPYILSEIDQLFYGDRTPPITRLGAAVAMIPYIEHERQKGTRLHQITRHMLGLFHGQPGARGYRQRLSTEGTSPDAGIACFLKALECVEGNEEEISPAADNLV